MAGRGIVAKRDKDKVMLIVWRTDCFVTTHAPSTQSYLNGYGR